MTGSLLILLYVRRSYICFSDFLLQGIFSVQLSFSVPKPLSLSSLSFYVRLSVSFSLVGVCIVLFLVLSLGPYDHSVNSLLHSFYIFRQTSYRWGQTLFRKNVVQDKRRVGEDKHHLGQMSFKTNVVPVRTNIIQDKRTGEDKHYLRQISFRT